MIGKARAVTEDAIVRIVNFPGHVAPIASRLRETIGVAPAPAPNPKRLLRDEAFAHFQNADGEPVLRYASVMFWDLMGISAMSSSPEDEALTHLRAIRTAVQEARERARTETTDHLRCSAWFTDNVVLATPVMESQDVELTLGPAFVDAAYMQLYLLRAGYLARGAISFGRHYMDETFVFGPALIEAHSLEEDRSGPRLPCVAVTKEVAELCREMGRKYYGAVEKSPFARELKIDEHGSVFVDHLGIWLDEEEDARVLDHWLPQYKALIRGKLKACPENGRVWKKWRWLADYHDYALRSRGLNRRTFITDLPSRHTFTTLT
jgi:hypothetical protein